MMLVHELLPLKYSRISNTEAESIRKSIINQKDYIIVCYKVRKHAFSC